MDVDLRIRHAELSDAAELTALVCDLGYKTTGAEMESPLVSILKDPGGKTLVALKDEKICGMLGTFSASSYLHNDQRPNHRACRVQGITTAWHRCPVGRSGGKGFRAARNHSSDADHSVRA